ncbi:MAG: MFS transporter [Cyclonatronaceae bacterium]
MSIFQFAWEYKRLVLFGFSLTFFSSFGQTFLISLFVPSFLEAFDISAGYFGVLYSAATLGSAFTLAWVGSYIDKVPLKRFAFLVVAGLALSMLFLASSVWVWMLLLGLFGLRLFGQGLCSHTAHTSMGRYFVTMRGKALSLSNLGFSTGEAFLPITITALIGIVGWRMGWAFSSLFVILVLPVVITLTLGRNPMDHAEPGVREAKDRSGTEPGSEWRRRVVIRDIRFYLFLPAAVASPFLLTGFFLYQTQLASFKGWDIEIVATAFIVFAIAKSAASLLSGPLIDRFRACRLFPFFLLPFFVGLMLLLLFAQPLIAFAYMTLAGISMGIAANVTTALYAELYGTANLGAIRSMMTMFMVISTAISPILFGTLLDWGIPFSMIIQGSLAYMLLSIILAIFIYREAENIIS